ncbi:hypothetical protein [Tahibacter caeni]|uniref:hypothetical protein n=1 Tax=Tahibacter caeni TaxID=1453545 RepID=UPI003CCD9EC7
MAASARPLVDAARLPPALRARLAELALRAPPCDDAARWRRVQIGERRWLCAQPITFTPYASAQPCSARCGFCSENLRHVAASSAAATLRPAAGYFDGLARALALLRDLPLSWSLSGLENTDDADWLLRLLDVLAAAERAGQPVEQRVLYSNGAGLAGARGEELQQAVLDFGLSRIELSRHHFDAARNQFLMRFRDQVAIRDGEVFTRTVRRLAPRVPVMLVCLLQRDGIATAEAIAAYLDAAARLGVAGVIFRELAQIGPDYRVNATARLIAQQRVRVDATLDAVFAHTELAAALRPQRLTEGYYFWNLVCRWRDRLDVVFEAADYVAMHERHDSGRLYKLVWFANGELCGGWEPGRRVIWSTRDG